MTQLPSCVEASQKSAQAVEHGLHVWKDST
jgi:hypothetical protein